MPFASGGDKKFRALIEAAPDPIAVFRDDVRIYANPALAKMLGHDSADDLVGRPISEVFHPDEHAVREERSARRDRGEKLEPYEYRLLHRSGAVLMAEVTSIGFELDDGPAVLVMIRDRTEQRRLESELRQAERLADVGAVAANVAHEINNPLAYVLANLEIIARRLPDLAGGDELQPLVAAAQEGAARVRAIAADLRTLARAEERPEGPIEIARAADAAIAISSAQLRGVEVVREHHDGARSLGHEGRLVQVLVNLLINAAQAEARTIVVRTESRGGVASIEIEDDGVGIPAHTLPRVFERFFSTKPREVGTGLGLPIAKDIVERMGGTLTIASAPALEARGTLVRVRLPALSPPAAEVRDRPRRRGRVLLVDDEPAIGRALSLALGEEHDVIAVDGGAAALDLLSRDAHFDVIFCDVTMPGLAGPEVFARAGAMGDRFVFLTGGATARTTERALAATGCLVLQKPFDLTRVEQLIVERIR